MKRRFFTTASTVALLAPRFAKADAVPAMQETPMFADQVKAGTLPPVDKRIPTRPSIVDHFAGSDGPGHSGGQINILVSSARDTRLMTLYSNARLIVYDDKFQLHPDILESYEVKDSREFTFKLRAGHKWSDGHPFTTEDFRYFWEDIANNKELSSGGPSVVLMVNGKPPKVDIIDELTIKYTWDEPNPYFISSQAQAAPLFLFRPAHYLKKFHVKYTSPEDIAKSAKGGQGANWVQIHKRLDVMYANDNPELPSLNAWVLETQPPAQRFVFKRNPYYYRIDTKGVQLPYLDSVVFTLAAANLIPAKAGLGESDLQPRYLKMRDYTFLRKSAKEFGSQRAVVGGRFGLAACALSQPQRQGRRLAQAQPRCPLPPRAVARHRPRRAEPGGVHRACQALEQHHLAALGAVQARVRLQVGELRPQAGQQAPRRGRTQQAQRQRHPPDA